jgi:hypothetical protein
MQLYTFSNTRVRLQRLGDAKFFTGWMKELTNISAQVTCKGGSKIESGDKFFVECHGKDKLASFQAVVDFGRGQDLVLSVTSQITYRAASESARVVVPGITGVANHNGLAFDFELIDVSENGMGVITSHPVSREERVTFYLVTPVGDIEGSGEVRYSKPDADAFGRHRLGFAMEPLDRLAQARWRQLYDTGI